MGATLDPCPTVAKAIPELLRQAATTVRKSSVPLKLNGPPVITLYQQQEFTDPGVIDQDDQVAVYFDRPKDIPGSYIQTYSIGPDEALDTVTRVIRVRDGPPKPFILGWFPDVDAGGMIVLLRFSHTVANVSAEGVTVSFGAGPVGIVNMTHEPAIDAWRLHLARGPTDEEAPVLQLVFSELACADPMPHGLCSPTLLALAMDQPLAVTVIEVAWQRGSVRVHLMPLVTVRGDGLDPSLFHAKWTSLSEVDGASVSRVETLPDQGMMVVVEFGSDRRTLEERQDLNGRQLLLCPQGSDLIDPTSRRILTDCLTIPRNLHSLIFCQKIRSNASMLQMRTSNNHFAVLLVRRTGL
ncbi:hypothetical protein HKX48_007110 [Thoreauomyces humboldtii]|nr:hypothetical protein HKX48_007110 [Thoreauomyces humboldtii]